MNPSIKLRFEGVTPEQLTCVRPCLMEADLFRSVPITPFPTGRIPLERVSPVETGGRC
jgi:hypothetical protein